MTLEWPATSGKSRNRVWCSVAELAEVFKPVREKLPGLPVRLIARSFLQTRPTDHIVGCITLGAPHHGTEPLASLAKSMPPQFALFPCGGINPGLFLLRRLPDKKMPPELLAGMGDELGSAASTRLEKAEHGDFGVNHMQLAFDPDEYCWIKGALSEKR